MSTVLRTRSSALELTLYSLATYLPGVLGLISTYVFTHALSSAEYGVFALWFATVLTIGSVLSQWIRQSILRYWKEYTQTTGDERFAHTIAGLTILMCLVLLCMGAIGVVIVIWLSYVGLLELYVTAVIAITLFTFVSIQQSIWQADRSPKPYTISRIITAVTTLVASLVLLSYQPTVLALNMGMVAGYGAAAGYGLVKQRRWFRYSGTLWSTAGRTIFKRTLAYGLPFIGWFIGTQILSYADRFIMGYFTSASAVGAYSAIYTLITGFISFLITPLLIAAHPAIVADWTRSIDKREAAHTLWQYVRLFMLIALPTVAGLCVVGRSIAQVLVPNEYQPDGWVVVLLAIGLFLNMFGLFTHKGLEMAEQTSRMLKLVVACALVNISLCIVLIPALGTQGAAWATVIAYLSYALVGLWLSRPHLSLQVDWLTLGRISLASLGVFVVALIFDNVDIHVSIVTRLAALSGASTIVYATLLVVLNELSIVELLSSLLVGYSWLRAKVGLQAQ